MFQHVSDRLWRKNRQNTGHWAPWCYGIDLNRNWDANHGGKLGDDCIQNFHLGRYIVGYTVRNLVLRRRASGAVKRDFRTYIRRYTSPK